MTRKSNRDHRLTDNWLTEKFGSSKSLTVNQTELFGSPKIPVPQQLTESPTSQFTYAWVCYGTNPLFFFTNENQLGLVNRG